jgi:hypothetical protein
MVEISPLDFIFAKDSLVGLLLTSGDVVVVDVVFADTGVAPLRLLLASSDDVVAGSRYRRITRSTRGSISTMIRATTTIIIIITQSNSDVEWLSPNFIILYLKCQEFLSARIAIPRCSNMMPWNMEADDEPSLNITIVGWRFLIDTTSGLTLLSTNVLNINFSSIVHRLHS